MKNNFIYILVISLLIPIQLNANVMTGIDTEVKKLIDEYQVPALSIAIIDNKKILYQKNFGYISLANTKKIDNKTIWQIASISKTFLAASLAILNDRQLISWDDKIIDHIDYFKLKNSDFTSKITIGDIASMQSGLPAAAGKENIASAQNNSEIIKNLSLVNSVAPPGVGFFSYQYSLLSIIEELISNKTGINWHRFVQKELFKKLNLQNTSIDIYKILDNKNIVRAVSIYNQEIEWEKFRINSAAGFYSSLEDMIKWLKFNMNQGTINKKSLISLAEMEKIHQSHTKINNNETYLYYDRNIEEISYGYFWKNLIYRFDNFETLVHEHNGNCEGVSAIISYLPNENIGIIVLSNKLTPVPEMIRSKLIQNIAKKYEN